MAKIVIIDTIIEKELLKKKLEIQTFFLCEPEAEMPPYQHGTICMKILEARTEDYEIINIVILENEQKKVSIERLVEALELCYNFEPDIISMSIGTTCLKDYQKLSGVIQALNEKGIILIAAPDNSCKITWPAAMDSVIGVTCDWKERLKPGEIRTLEENIFGLDLVANANLEFKNEPVAFGQSNSYAVPIVVSLLNTCINKGIRGKERILTEIQNSFGTALAYEQLKYPEKTKLEIFDEPVVLCQGLHEEEFVPFIEWLWEEHMIQAVGITDDLQTDDFTLLARNRIGTDIESFVSTCLQKDLVLFSLNQNQSRLKWDVLIQGEEKQVVIKSAEEEIYVQTKDDQQWLGTLVNNLVEMLTE
ncbi:S8 family serine peptidase [Anaerosacchariphilus polymeriproducens]|uniref:Peptidase S8/S53 domain-containing protein n=1 Tax=Anaerosacchariphilus polymeriproducens TaxID=1812858 RepID=A0A371AWA6_9FIRM|nr:S8 family serine peptidase [Anaerosacchariphilus polymeriproducens]RDU23821.1 hypothetical protein DWV06_08160 [Anaerosacchariphilus polymeriproducens]